MSARRGTSPIVAGIVRVVVALSLSLAQAFAARASEIDIVGPPGTGFGWNVTVLPNGNIVVQDGDSIGAVYLYRPDGSLVSTLRGSVDGDYVGAEPVTVLPNGDFVVVSYAWHNGDAEAAGAVTYVDGTTGVDGVVGPDNSLVGSSAFDEVGQSLVVLANGNVLVVSYNWANGANDVAGAVTFMPAGGLHGAVSPANSLVGTSLADAVGCGVVALANGNYLVVSPRADVDGVTDAGAITWGDGTLGVVGTISVANSLVGVRAGDALGSGPDGYVRAFALANGNAVVLSSNWDNGAIADAGAATWIDGAHGLTGSLSSANSLVGTTADDAIGATTIPDAVVELPGDRYAVLSPGWSSATTAHVGAITWGSTSLGIRGAVTAENSLVGSTTDDFRSARVTTLANGNWVVGAPNWTHGQTAVVGAATWIDGSAPRVGIVSPSNSLIGSNEGDGVGSSVVALANGNYVVGAPSWSHYAGAATWADGAMPRSDEVSAANSLVGSSSGDRIGEAAGDVGIVALANGNYIVMSSNWRNGGLAFAGAVTWGDGSSGVAGHVGAENSLVGDRENDTIGMFATPLANGDVVTSSIGWHDGAGAATLIDGNSGLTGFVSESNSITGNVAGDQVGIVSAIPHRDGYFVATPWWMYGDIANAGAVAWSNGRTGYAGAVTAASALTGTHYLEQIGEEVVGYANGTTVIGGAFSVTLARGTAPLSGTPDARDSVLTSGSRGHSFAYDEARDRLVVGWYASGYVAIFQADSLLATGFD